MASEYKGCASPTLSTWSDPSFSVASIPHSHQHGTSSSHQQVSSLPLGGARPPDAIPPHPTPLGRRTGCPLMKPHPEVWSAHPVAFAWAYLNAPFVFSIQDIMVEGQSSLSLSHSSSHAIPCLYLILTLTLSIPI